jgi:hypothetical protein
VTTIRSFEPGDAEAVAALYQRVIRPGDERVRPAVRAWFRRMFAHPWADPEIGPLVAVEKDGRIVGFQGVHVRRMSLDGEPLRMAVGGQLVVDPGARRGATGVLLMRRLVGGPQDLTFCDGATEEIRVMWERMHGERFALACTSWLWPLRPAAAVGDLLARRRAQSLPKAAAAVTSAVDRAAAPLLRRRAPTTASARVTTEPLAPERLLAALPEATGRLRLVPDYDDAFLPWLLEELAAVRNRGALRGAIVREGDSVLGYYAYYLRVRGVSPVLAVVAATEERSAVVLDVLAADARAAGAAALEGRVEPRLQAPLYARKAFLRYTGGVILHTRDPALLWTATSRHAVLTRMEGEWWLEPHLLAAEPLPAEV